MILRKVPGKDQRLFTKKKIIDFFPNLKLKLVRFSMFKKVSKTNLGTFSDLSSTDFGVGTFKFENSGIKYQPSTHCKT